MKLLHEFQYCHLRDKPGKSLLHLQIHPHFLHGTLFYFSQQLSPNRLKNCVFLFPLLNAIEPFLDLLSFHLPSWFIHSLNLGVFDVSQPFSLNELEQLLLLVLVDIVDELGLQLVVVLLQYLTHLFPLCLSKCLDVFEFLDGAVDFVERVCVGVFFVIAWVYITLVFVDLLHDLLLQFLALYFAVCVCQSKVWQIGNWEEAQMHLAFQCSKCCSVDRIDSNRLNVLIDTEIECQIVFFNAGILLVSVDKASQVISWINRVDSIC